MELIDALKAVFSAGDRSDVAVFDENGKRIWFSTKNNFVIPKSLCSVGGFAAGKACNCVMSFFGKPFRVISYEENGEICCYSAEVCDGLYDADMSEFFLECRLSIFNNINIARRFNFVFEEKEMYEDAKLASSQISNSYSLLRQLVNFNEVKNCNDGVWNSDVFDVSKFAKELVETSKYLLRNTSKNISCSIPDEELFIKADSERFCNAFLNILTNALQFSFEDAKVKITLEKSGNNVVISIKDNGIGIPASEMPYVQNCGHAYVTDDNRPHSGFGLFIAKEFAKRANGNLLISSKENEGTTVSLTIPVSSEKEPLILESSAKIYKGGFSPVEVAICNIIDEKNRI